MSPRTNPPPGRNDPCHCASGRKYKRCCLPADEARDVGKEAGSFMGLPAEPDGKLRRRIIRFLEEELSDGNDYAREALCVWLGRPRNDPGPFDQEWEETEFIIFMDYVVHDFIATGRDAPALELFLRQKSAGLSPQEQRLLECWRENSVGFYEVQRIQRGMGIAVKDLLLGEECFVRDVSASRRLERWDIFAGRILKEPEQHTLSGAITLIPRPQRMRILEEVRKRWRANCRRQTKGAFRAFMKTHWPDLRRFIWEEASRLPEFRTRTGETMLFCRAWYEVLDHPKTKSHLDTLPELQYAGPHEDPHMGGERYDWVNSNSVLPLKSREEGVTFQTTRFTAEGKEGGVILGNITLFEKEMEVWCLSKERLECLMGFLEKCAGSAIQRKGTLIQQPEEALEQFRRSGRQDGRASEIPPEVERKLLKEYFTGYYTRWVDMPIPAFDGLTPRQASKNAAYQSRLEDLLKDFEHAERDCVSPRIPGFSSVRLIRKLLGLRNSQAPR